MSLKALQAKIGVLADGNFGPKTLKAAAAYFKFTPERAAHFFGQVATETGNFAAFSENLNYSADGLQRVFGKYFPGDLEQQIIMDFKALLQVAQVDGIYIWTELLL